MARPPLHSDNTPTARRGTVSTSTTVRAPEVSRGRSSSASPAAHAPAQTARKRTSSGVFQVEESEPPPKKSEDTKEKSEERNHEVISNGRRKRSESEKEKVKERKIDKDLVIKRFDSGKTVECVTAFKESDSWD